MKSYFMFIAEEIQYYYDVTSSYYPIHSMHSQSESLQTYWQVILKFIKMKKLEYPSNIQKRQVGVLMSNFKTYKAKITIWYWHKDILIDQWEQETESKNRSSV
jgi:hypothetical protein